MYSPALGCFLSRDPAAALGEPDILYDNNWFGHCLAAIANLYTYSYNNPVNYVDPDGMEPASTTHARAARAAPQGRPRHPTIKPCNDLTLLPKGCSRANILKAIGIANAAVNGAGPCQQWFDQHARGIILSSICVQIVQQIPFFPTLTTPQGPIYLGADGCCLSPVVLASLFIHELAHHYCPQLWGRETCAIDAQNACENEIT